MPPGHSPSPHALSQNLSHETDICHRSNRKMHGEAPGVGAVFAAGFPPGTPVTESDGNSNGRSTRGSFGAEGC